VNPDLQLLAYELEQALPSAASYRSWPPLRSLRALNCWKRKVSRSSQPARTQA